jgi:hypothetical protein
LCSGFDRALLLDQRPVQLAAAVAEEVELVLTGNDVVLVPRLLDVDLGDEQGFLGVARLGQTRSVRVDDLAPAAELAPALLADPVRAQQVDRFSAARATVISSVCTLAAIGKFVGSATRSAPRSASVRVTSGNRRS